MSIRDFLNKDTFNYRLKFAFEPTTKQLEEIIHLLTIKYKAFDFQPLVKTMFQARPLDFSNLDAGEIWMLDFSTPRGLQDAIVLVEVGKQLKCSTAYLRVRNKDDMYQSMLSDENALGLDLDEYIPKVTDPHYETDAIAIDKSLVGQERADQVVKDTIEKYREGNGGYYKYMEAAFGKDGGE